MNFESLLLARLKKLILVILVLSIGLCAASPYLVSWYTERKYNNLTNFMRELIPGVKIINHIRRGYLKSLLLSKIELPTNFLWQDLNEADSLNNSNKINHINNRNNSDNIYNVKNTVEHDYLSKQIITLKHSIFYNIHKKSLVTINTKVLIGLPKFMQDFNLITDIDFKGNITTTIKDIDINYISPLVGNKLKSLITEKASIYINNDHKNLFVNFKFPKIVYKEHENVLDIDNLQLNIKFKDFNESNKRRIKFLTEVDKLYLVSQNATILRLANFSMEQRFSDKVTSNLSFFKLNVLDSKFGPLVTKVQLHNINFSKLIEHFNYLKLPINEEQLRPYKLVESINQLFQYKPSASLDLLLHVGQDKLKFLSDAMLDSRNSEWFNREDIINSLTANIFAKVPKEIMLDLISKLVEHQQNKKILELTTGSIDNDSKKLLSNDLENLVLEKMQYLINHNILKEESDGYIVNLSIVEGTFFSKNNPFKLFSF